MGSPSHAFYLRPSEGVFVLVDLTDPGAQPRATHRERVIVDAALDEPRPDGLPSKPTYRLLEERFAALCAEHDAWFAGRVLGQGSDLLVAYASDASALMQAVSAAELPLPVLTSTEHDPAWQCFSDILAPSRAAWELIRSMDLFRVRGDHGDDPLTPRQVDHGMVFPDAARADQAVAELVAKGFRETNREASDGGGVFVEMVRRDAASYERIAAVLEEIMPVVEKYDGEYDGWGAPIVRR